MLRNQILLLLSLIRMSNYSLLTECRPFKKQAQKCTCKRHYVHVRCSAEDDFVFKGSVFK